VLDESFVRGERRRMTEPKSQPLALPSAFLRARPDAAPSLHYLTSIPQGKPRALVGIVPGYADHGARYAHVMAALREQGIASVALDLRGHGQSEGPRGACKNFREFLDDMNELPKLLDGVDASAPKFLLAHSFGGLVAVSGVLAGLTRAYRGLLLSDPFLGLGFEPPALKRLAGEIASLLVPSFGLPSGLKGSDVTHDEKIARAYDDDPLVFKNANARWFTEAVRAQKRALEGAGDIQIPLYLAFGESDTLASIKVAQEFFAKVSSQDKVFVSLPGLRHEILNEPSYRETLAGMVSFIEKHL
jgi:alpha-beta hydrolase superfamily lysophospholipase